jgi:hypothetical protein
MNTLEQKEELLKCCFCKQDIEVNEYGWKYGHNPSPLMNGDDDRCCDRCNENKVMSFRLFQLGIMLPKRK